MWAQLSGRPSREVELVASSRIVRSLDGSEGSRDCILGDSEVAGDSRLKGRALRLGRSTLGTGVSGVCGRDCAPNGCRREPELLGNRCDVDARMSCLVLPCDGARGTGGRLSVGRDREGQAGSDANESDNVTAIQIHAALLR